MTEPPPVTVIAVGIDACRNANAQYNNAPNRHKKIKQNKNKNNTSKQRAICLASEARRGGGRRLSARRRPLDRLVLVLALVELRARLVLLRAPQRQLAARLRAKRTTRFQQQRRRLGRAMRCRGAITGGGVEVPSGRAACVRSAVSCG